MMNLAELDLNLLVALESLLEEASVSRAADRVALSQPAMSHALKRLRTLLGDPLLVRVGARMQLTARGESLRHPVRETLSLVRDLFAEESFEPKRSSRTFRLFVADHVGDLLLPLLLRQLETEAPNVRIRVQSGGGNMLDPLDLTRSVDAAIACVPNVFKGFYQQRLFTDHDVCVLRCGHPLARRTLRLEEFLQARHVAVVGREFREDLVDSWLRQEGYERNVALSVPHYLQALHVVSQSDVMAVIPERLVSAYAEVLSLELSSVPLDVGTFDEYLLHSARTHVDAGNVWLRGILKKVATSLGPLRPTLLRRQN